MRSYAADTALEFTYGYKKAQHDDVIINSTLEHASSTLVGRMSPEIASLSHKFPICKFSLSSVVDGERSIPFVHRLVDYIPGFVLGTSLSQKLISKVKDIPYEYLKQNLVRSSLCRVAITNSSER